MGHNSMQINETKNGKADHPFEIFLKEKSIQQILCGVNHPQTNGKQEKFVLIM